MPYINYIKPQTKMQTHHNILSPYQHFLSNTSDYVIGGSLIDTTQVTFLKTDSLLVLCRDIKLTFHTPSERTYQLTNLSSSMGIIIFWFGVFRIQFSTFNKFLIARLVFTYSSSSSCCPKASSIWSNLQPPPILPRHNYPPHLVFSQFFSLTVLIFSFS